MFFRWFLCDAILFRIKNHIERNTIEKSPRYIKIACLRAPHSYSVRPWTNQMYPYSIQHTHTVSKQRIQKTTYAGIKRVRVLFSSRGGIVLVCSMPFCFVYITSSMYSHLVWFFMRVSFVRCDLRQFHIDFCRLFFSLTSVFFPLDKLIEYLEPWKKIAHANNVMYTLFSEGSLFGIDSAVFIWNDETIRLVSTWVIYIE